jgi:hypothetical protein
MNKVISVQPHKKRMDNNDDQEQYESYEESYLNLSINNINPFHKSLNDQNILLNELCENEKCKEITLEIERIKEDCLDLEKKILIIDKTKTEDFIDISSKLSKVCKHIDELQPKIDHFQGINLGNLTFKQLENIEMNLMDLLIKVKKKISEIEYDVMEGFINKPEDHTILCQICKENEINCFIHPCSHVCICCECASQTVKCPICYKFIEFYDKIFLPNFE